jgi:hypothetical protein
VDLGQPLLKHLHRNRGQRRRHIGRDHGKSRMGSGRQQRRDLGRSHRPADDALRTADGLHGTRITADCTDFLHGTRLLTGFTDLFHGTRMLTDGLYRMRLFTDTRVVWMKPIEAERGVLAWMCVDTAVSRTGRLGAGGEDPGTARHRCRVEPLCRRTVELFPNCARIPQQPLEAADIEHHAVAAVSLNPRRKFPRDGHHLTAPFCRTEAGVQIPGLSHDESMPCRI